MKRILFILVLFVCTGLSAQQYFFNGTVYVPKTTAQINAISSPQEGRQEYNSTTGTMWVYNGSSWEDTGEVSIADGSITEAKLNTSVNASLDLADSALQSGDNVSELVNDAGYITEGGNLIPVTQAEYDLLTPTEIQENDYAIVGEGDSSGGGATQLSDLSDVNTSTPTNRNVLVADGVDWESRALVEADISDLKQYLPLTGGTMSGILNMGGNSIISSGSILPDGGNKTLGSSSTYFLSSNVITYRHKDVGASNIDWTTSASGGTYVFTKETGQDTNTFTLLYSLNGTGTPTNSTDLITKAYGDANYSGSGGGIQSVVAGSNISVDNTDAENPVVSSPNSVTSTPFGFDNRLIKSSGTDRVVQSTGITISDTNVMDGIEGISSNTGVFATSLQSGSFVKSGATSDDVLLGNGSTTSLNGIKTAPGLLGNGTTEIILGGSTSGAYTVGSQSWRWFRSHDLVFFFMNFNNIDGTTPVGQLRVDISGSTFPPPDANGTTVFNVHINDWPTAEIYSAYAIEDTANYITILVNTGAATSSGSPVIDMDFTGTTDIFISGIYRTTN